MSPKIYNKMTTKLQAALSKSVIWNDNAAITWPTFKNNTKQWKEAGGRWTLTKDVECVFIGDYGDFHAQFLWFSFWDLRSYPWSLQKTKNKTRQNKQTIIIIKLNELTNKYR